MITLYLCISKEKTGRKPLRGLKVLLHIYSVSFFCDRKKLHVKNIQLYNNDVCVCRCILQDQETLNHLYILYKYLICTYFVNRNVCAVIIYD